MDALNISYIALALMAVAGVVIFLLRKSKLNEVRVHHGLDADSLKVAAQGITAVERAATKAFDSVDNLAGHAFPAVSNVADRAAEIAETSIAPLSRGVGDVLSAVADRIRTRQADLNTLTSQAIALAQEVERLRGRQIDVTKVTAQLKLGLIEISKQYDSWKRETFDVVSKSTFGSTSATEYVGLQRATYRLQIGLDIERLRFELVSDNRVLVEGLQNIEIIGLKGLAIKELFGEKRRSVKGGFLASDKAEILDSDADLAERVQTHRDTVLSEIQGNESVEDLKEANASFGLAFLQACLSAGGFKVEESKKALAEPLRFTELCHSINRLVTQQLNTSYEKQIEIEGKSRSIEGEILALAMSPRSGDQ